MSAAALIVHTRVALRCTDLHAAGPVMRLQHMRRQPARCTSQSPLLFILTSVRCQEGFGRAVPLTLALRCQHGLQV